MRETEQLITLYHTGFLICLGLTILFVVLSIVFFFLFNIRNVFDYITGRGEKRSVRLMEEENAKTGKLRQDYSDSNTTGDLYRTPSGSVPPKIYTATEQQQAADTASRSFGRTGGRKNSQPNGQPNGWQNNQQTGQPDKPQGSQSGAQQSASTGGDATTLLNSGAEGTTILNSGGGETTLLNYDEAETGVLSHGMAEQQGGEAETGVLSQGMAAQYGTEAETGLLSPNMLADMENQSSGAKGRFDIIKEEMMIHTDEIII